MNKSKDEIEMEIADLRASLALRKDAALSALINDDWDRVEIFCYAASSFVSQISDLELDLREIGNGS